MTPQEVKDIRAGLGITQEALSEVLGLNKTSVMRYETGKARPTGATLTKLLQLQETLKDEEGRTKLRKLLCQIGGAAMLASMISFSAALFLGPIGLFAALKSGPGRNLISSLQDFTARK